MAKVRRIIMWAVLILIALLILFSVYGAFIGADRAYTFFNSIPLSFYWTTFVLVLGAGIALFRRLLRSPGLLLIHIGVLAILIGAMWGSEKGLQLQKKMLGTNKIRTGTIIIYEGLKEKRVFNTDVDFQFSIRDTNLVFFEGDRPLKDNDERIFLLPFEIKLNDFRMDYYDSPRLHVKSSDGAELVFKSIESGKRYNIGENTWLTVKDMYKNFKLRQNNDKFEAYDQAGPGSNPAVRAVIRYPDGTEDEQFVFANHPGHMEKTSRFSLQYQIAGIVRDYFSDVQVIDNGKIVLEKSIQVNDPLYYGGYHFYQSSYDTKEGKYTVLSVTSDSGLYIVYAGYFLLMAGIIWHMWVISVLRNRNLETKNEEEYHGA